MPSQPPVRLLDLLSATLERLENNPYRSEGIVLALLAELDERNPSHEREEHHARVAAAAFGLIAECLPAHCRDTKQDEQKSSQKKIDAVIKFDSHPETLYSEKVSVFKAAVTYAEKRREQLRQQGGALR